MSKPRSRPLPRTPVALSVLNLLNERPMHPYEMRSLMRERGHDGPSRSGSPRFTTPYPARGPRVHRAGRRQQGGRRPERTVYAITEAGRDELLVWLRDLTSEPAADYPAFAAPLMFIYALGRDGAISALRERAARLEAEISRSDAFRRIPGRARRLPADLRIEEEYAQAMRKAELAWVRGRSRNCGRLASWPQPENSGEVKPALVKRKQKSGLRGGNPGGRGNPERGCAGYNPGSAPSRIVPASAAPSPFTHVNGARQCQ